MKLRNKLILSCAALAAVATTAVSTTYAWYTANDTVKANGIEAATSQTDNTLLLISTSGKSGSWGASVNVGADLTLDPVEYSNGKYYTWDSTSNSTYSVVPANASFDSEKTYYTLAEGVYTEAEDLAAFAEGVTYYTRNVVSGGLTSGSFMSFYLYFKSGSNTNLDVRIKSFTLTNTQASSLPAMSVLAEGTTSTDTTYTVDMFRALNIATITKAAEEVASNGTSPVIANPITNETAGTTRSAFNCAGKASDDTLKNKTAGSTVNTNYNAHRYYNNVKGTSIDTTKLYSETTTDILANTNDAKGLGVAGYTLGATGAGGDTTDGLDNMLVVRFDIYLDGWNAACFDAVRKQDFTLSMEFDGVEHA